MKKSILLIAPLAFIWSCTQSSEIFDDAYNGTEPKPVIQTDGEGYADYIKQEEGNYTVIVDSGNTYRSGLQPSFYNNSTDNRYSANQNPNVFYRGERQAQNSQLGWNSGCDRGFAPGMGWGYSGFYPMGYHYGDAWGGHFGYATPSGYWNTFYGNPMWSNQWGYASYFGNGFGYYNSWNGFYDPYFGYYGNGWNNWNGWNGYGWGYGGNPYWGYGGWNTPGFNNWNNNNNNNTNWGESSGGGSNHYYGHRGGTNTGSYSQNTTNYEHTVKAQDLEVASTPFPLYSSMDKNEMATNIFESKPVKPANVSSNTFNGSNAVPNGNGSIIKPVEKPSYVNTNSVNERPGSFTTAKPVYNNNSSTLNNSNVSTSTNYVNTTPVRPTTTKVLKTGKPAQNQFAGGNSTNSISTNRPSNPQSNVVSGSNSTLRTYDHPNKYGNQTNNTYSNNKPGNVYNAGQNTSNSRRTNVNTNSNNNRNTNYNSGSNRRTSSSSTNYGSRSSSSGSSSSGTSSSGSRRR
jgi:hypothetical protein